jgi:hypothetical protein
VQRRRRAAGGRKLRVLLAGRRRRAGLDRLVGLEALDVPGQPGTDWSAHEVRLIVADYFAMLARELLGKDYSKAEHRRALLPQLGGRSDGSVEYKHANISAVLTEQGLPYSEGYKPRGNYQALLAQEVDAFLDQHPSFLEQLAAAPTVSPDKPLPPRKLTWTLWLRHRPSRSLVRRSWASRGCRGRAAGSISRSRTRPTAGSVSGARSS